MALDPTKRFSARADNYARFRPGYPAAVVSLLAKECGLSPRSRIADVGSGTGNLAKLFLDFGCEVFGVEPNREMRLAGEEFLARRPRFHSIDARAEATTLPDHVVDFVTAGQAFHWFDAEKARREFQRILTPPGWAALVWNERKKIPGFMSDYEELVSRFGPERQSVLTEDLSRFFGEAVWRVEKMPNEQRFDLEGLRGRFLSNSYAPDAGTPECVQLLKELDRIFSKHQQSGWVTILYDTETYFGKLLE